MEIQKNFKHHAYTSLGKLLMKTTKNKEKDFQEALHCFNEALDVETGDVENMFDLYLGRAKLNILRNQCGHTKDDCLSAIKVKSGQE